MTKFSSSNDITIRYHKVEIIPSKGSQASIDSNAEYLIAISYSRNTMQFLRQLSVRF